MFYMRSPFAYREEVNNKEPNHFSFIKKKHKARATKVLVITLRTLRRLSLIHI